MTTTLSQLSRTLSLTLRRLEGDGPVLEVCAGTGELARALISSGVRLLATDAEPPKNAEVLRMSAQTALRRFQPSVVLGSFVPFDGGVDKMILSYPSVRHYVVLNARIWSNMLRGRGFLTMSCFSDGYQGTSCLQYTKYPMLCSFLR